MLSLILDLNCTTTLICLCVLICATLLWMRRDPAPLASRRPPPGPRGISCFLQLLRSAWRQDTHTVAWKWAEQYGSLVFFDAFGVKLCYVNSASMARKLLAGAEYKPVTSGRVGNFTSNLVWYNGKDMFFTPYDAILKKKRKLLHKAMGLYGEGVERFESVVGMELDDLIDKLTSMNGQDVQMDEVLADSLKNMLYILVKGRLPPTKADVDAVEDYDMSANALFSGDVQFVLMGLPWVRHFPGKFKTLFQKMLKHRAKAEEIMFSDLKETDTPGEMGGLVDVIFQHRDTEGYEFLKDEEHIKGMFAFIFFAAHLTSRATLLNAFLILLHHPDTVRKLQAEIDSVLGNKTSSFHDRSRMPYAEAIVLEVLRYNTQIPLNCARVVKEDLPVDGYVIPKGTQILLNNWFFHRDPTEWDDPWTFRPERFLDEEGHLLPADHWTRQKLLSFGFGNRMCPGEVFARSRVFLYLTRIFQKFNLKPPESEPLQSCHPNDSVKMLVRQAPQFRCRVTPRESTEV